MASLGVIARADNGGLGVQFQEFCRHMRPDAAIVLDLGVGGRGGFDAERITPYVSEYLEHTGSPISDWAIDWLLERSDVLYLIEGPMSPHLFERARKANVKTVLHVNPELLRSEYDPDVMWNPTTYGNLPMVQEVPFPVATDRLPFRLRDQARTFLHVCAPAMADRNGTELVNKALSYVQSEITVKFANYPAAHPGERWTVNSVQCEAVGPVVDYWDRYSDDIDVLLLPRRYAGLSLPTQEAAACGIPSIMLETSPYAVEGHAISVPSYCDYYERFAGGQFEVATCSTQDLARMIDRVACQPLQGWSQRVANWAKAISWSALLSEYRQRLC